MPDSFTQMCRFANTTAVLLFIFADNCVIVMMTTFDCMYLLTRCR